VEGEPMTAAQPENLDLGDIDLRSELVLLIADLTAGHDGARDLATEHLDDGTGYCGTCSPAAGAGRITWPCTLFRIGVGAAELQRRRKLAS
jgi:hypothetical protein